MREMVAVAGHSGTIISGSHDYLRAVQRLHNFKVWHRAQDLAYAAYQLTLAPALNRHFALIDQVRRASLSIPANIAEGYSLGTTAQFVRCLKVSLGSSTELATHLELLRRLELIPREDVQKCQSLCNEVISMLIGLIRALGRRTL